MAAPARPKPPRAGLFAPLRDGPFRLLAGGRVISMVGNAMAPIALAFAVLDLTGSVRDLGLVVGARSLTNVAFLLFGGVIADRLPRRVVLTVACALAALTQGMVATLVLTGTATIGWLAGLAAINGLVSSFAFPAAGALQAQAVPPPLRQQANALTRVGLTSASILGAALGGVLVAGVGPGWGLAADAVTFVLAGACFAGVRVPDVRAARAAGGMLHELRVGWAEFVARTWVWVVVLAFCFINAAEVGAVQVLGPAVADATVGRRAWGLILAAQTAGMVVGALIAMRLRLRRLLRWGIFGAAGGVGLLVALAVAPRIAVLLPAAFLTGIVMEQFAVAWETTIQEYIPPDKYARVYSFDALGSFAAIPIGQVVAGPVAAAVGVTPTLLGAAGITVLAVAGMLVSRDVRTLERRPAALPSAPEPAPVG
ncbi:MAG: MFS transporter [Micromonosporaceae bacterium]